MDPTVIAAGILTAALVAYAIFRAYERKTDRETAEAGIKGLLLVTGHDFAEIATRGALYITAEELRRGLEQEKYLLTRRMGRLVERVRHVRGEADMQPFIDCVKTMDALYAEVLRGGWPQWKVTEALTAALAVAHQMNDAELMDGLVDFTEDFGVWTVTVLLFSHEISTSEPLAIDFTEKRSGPAA